MLWATMYLSISLLTSFYHHLYHIQLLAREEGKSSSWQWKEHRQSKEEMRPCISLGSGTPLLNLPRRHNMILQVLVSRNQPPDHTSYRPWSCPAKRKRCNSSHSDRPGSSSSDLWLSRGSSLMAWLSSVYLLVGLCGRMCRERGGY